MKNKIVILIMALICSVSFVLGLVGVVNVKNDSKGKNGDINTDMIVGLFLTPEDLFLMKHNENTVYHVSSKDELMDAIMNERIFAERVPSDDPYNIEFKFPVEGYAFIEYRQDFEGEPCSYTSAGLIYNDLKIATVKNDTGTKNSVEVTAYGGVTEAEKRWYVNIVYETADGRVYAEPSDRMIGVGGKGVRWSQTMSYNNKVSRKTSDSLKKNGSEATEESELIFHFIRKNTAVGFEVIQFDENYKLLSRKKYDVTDMPEYIKKEKNTNLIVVVSSVEKEDGIEQETRSYSKDDEKIELFVTIPDGFAVNKTIEIK